MKFDIKGLINESKQTLLSPKEYFTAMPKTDGYVEPIIKTLVYGLFSGFIVLIWNFLGVAAASGLGKTSIIKYPVIALATLFVFATFLWLISLICGGDKSYETSIRVQASFFVLMPINALLSALYGINPYLGLLISLAVNLFGLWLFLNGLLYGLSAIPLRAKVVSGIFAGLVIILSIFAIVALKFTQKFTETMMKDGSLTPQDIQQMQDNPEEAQKKIEELMQKYLQNLNTKKE